MTEKKSCPFCGGKVIWVRDPEDCTEIRGIYCHGCKALVKWNIQVNKKAEDKMMSIVPIAAREILNILEGVYRPMEKIEAVNALARLKTAFSCKEDRHEEQGV